MPGWRPRYPGEVPTLGYEVLEWIEDMLACPDRSSYEPLILTPEQRRFIVSLYALDPATGRRRFRRAVYSRSKGGGKSPLMAAVAAVEALGPVVFDGWDADGRPVGMPWSRVRTPWVQLAAVSEDQTRNAWGPLLEMLREGPVLDEYPGLEPMESFVNLPKGKIEYVTSAATSREGNRPVFVVLDQTESWVPSNGGVKLAAAIRRNLGKTGGTSVECPNAYEPGAGSVAENSAEYWKQIREGRTRNDGLLYDHREAPPETDMTDHDSLLEGLQVAYGDAAEERGGWVDLERVIAEVWDPDTLPQEARRYYLNQVTHATDAWLSQPEWSRCADTERIVAEGDTITFGFDGSRGRERGVADATALVGCRLSDGFVFQIAIWEPPEGPAAKEWKVPLAEVDATVHETFRRYNAVGFFADPARWESYVADWEARYAKQLKVKATQQHPIEWWTQGGRIGLVVRALEQFQEAVKNQELVHAGDHALTRHVLNARMRSGRGGITIHKEHPDSARKIDGAMAATLAWQARLAALSKGLQRPRSRVIQRF